MKKIILLIIISILLYRVAQSQNIQIRAWIQDGYYFSHRCQITIEVVSDYFQTSYQLFHVFAQQNINFFLTSENLNIFYIKGNNSMQAKMTPSSTYCKFSMSTNYYCPFISLRGYNPLNLNYFDTYNSTHRKMTFRINRAICGQQSNNMKIRIQMPIHSDYNSFYLYMPSLTDSTILTVDKLSFVYDRQILINAKNLKYKQIKQISFIKPVNYLTGCKFVYSIQFIFDNLTYYDSWNEINIYISNQQILSLSSQCQSNLLKKFTCAKTTYGYQLVNLNSINIVKSYQIAQSQYYQNNPIDFSISFGIQFFKPGQSNIEVIVKSYNNKIQQDWLNMTHNSSQIYGRMQKTIRGYEQNQLIKIQDFSILLDPLKCIDPININKISNSSSQITTNNSLSQNSSSINNQNNTQINNQTNLNNTFYQKNNSIRIINNTNKSNNNQNNSNNQQFNDYNFQIIDTQIKIQYLVIIFTILFIIILLLFIRKTIKPYEKLLYLILIIILPIIKIIFISLKIDQSWLINKNSSQQTDSIIINYKNSQQSLQIFIIKNTFYLQLMMGIIYYINYLLILIFSQQIKDRIKRFYGTKIIYYNKKQNKYNFSSIVFIILNFITFLFNYKIYGVFLYKLHANINLSSSNIQDIYKNNKEEYKKYRFKNITIYKIHYKHLSIQVLFTINYLIWLLFLIKRSQNQLFNYFLYAFFIIGCMQLFLTVIVLKSFYFMSKISQQYNKKDNHLLRNKSTLIQINYQKQELQIKQHQKIQEFGDKYINQ